MFKNIEIIEITISAPMLRARHSFFPFLQQNYSDMGLFYLLLIYNSINLVIIYDVIIFVKFSI